MEPSEISFFLSLGVWVLLGVASLLFFQFNKNARLKKRILPFFIVGAGILFILLFVPWTGRPMILLFVLPAVALMTYLNLKMIRLCDSCGSTVTSNVWFAKSNFCSKCGARLQ